MLVPLGLVTCAADECVEGNAGAAQRVELAGRGDEHAGATCAAESLLVTRREDDRVEPGELVPGKTRRPTPAVGASPRRW